MVLASSIAAAWSGASSHPAAQTQNRANWLTDGGDPQRTAWQQNETILTKDNVKDMKLLWKIKLDNQPRQMHSLFPPLIAGNVTTTSRRRRRSRSSPASPTTSTAIDVEKGTLLWKRHFDSTFKEPPPQPGGRGGSVLCPGGLTATPVIAPTSTPGKYVVYAVSWDGRLRKLDVATGEEIEPPALFVPPNGKPYGLNLVNGVIYTTTAQGCGGNPNKFYAYDLATKKVGNWAPGSGGMWPRTGPSVGKDGTVYAGSGDGDYLPEQQIYGQAIIGVKQNPQTKALELKDWYAPSNAYWLRKRDLDLNVTGPIFDYKGKEYLVQSSKECRSVLLDTRDARRRGPSHAGLPHAAHLQRGSELHDGRLGRAGDLGGRRRHALGADAVLGAEAPAVQGADRARPGRLRRRRGVQDGGQARASRCCRPPGSRATCTWRIRRSIANGIVFAYGSGESTTQRWPEPGHVGGAQGRIAGIDARGALRARRADREGAVVERRSDRVVEPLQRPVGRQRPRLHRHLRRHAVLLRRGRACQPHVRIVAAEGGAR